MNILILGSGGREHALAWAVKQNPKCDRLIVAPGNAGIAQIAVLMLGHRRRLLTQSVMRHVIGASVHAGHVPTFFAVLENMTMQRPTLFGMGVPRAHPHFRRPLD